MNEISAHRLILQYVEGWKTGNRGMILETLDSECVVIESYGPIYSGIEMVGRWIDAWFVDNNRVNQWDVTSFYYTDETCFFEWVFECTFAGTIGGFEGASIAQFNNEKLVFLREYAMTAKRYEWQGKWR